MRNRKLTYKLVISLIALAVALAACAPTAKPVAAPQPTAVPPTATTRPSPIPTATPQPTAVPPTATPQPSLTATRSPGAFPMTVTDSLNRKVQLASAPQRVISLAPSLTEILFAVGAGDKVVGVTQYCNYPPEAAQKEKIGGFSAKTISVEKIIALKPDLVLAAGAIHQPVIEALQAANIPVVSIAGKDVPGVYSDILLIGQMTGQGEKAAQVVDNMKTRIAAVQAKLATIPKEKRLTVLWETWDEPLMTAGPSTFTGQMVELAGGVNIFADLKEEYPQVSLEEVVKRNPAVIMAPDTHGEKLTPERVAQRPGWDRVDAVRNKRIVLINGDIASRAGPRIADAVEMMAKALYPELFK